MTITVATTSIISTIISTKHGWESIKMGKVIPPPDSRQGDYNKRRIQAINPVVQRWGPGEAGGKWWYQDAVTRELISKLWTAQANIKLKITQIKTLDMRLKKATTQRIKKQVRMDFPWNGEESIFANMVTQFCKTYLFPQFKFLKNGWNEFDQNCGSLSSLVNQHIKVLERADYEDQWEWGIVPTIWLST